MGASSNYSIHGHTRNVMLIRLTIEGVILSLIFNTNGQVTRLSLQWLRYSHTWPWQQILLPRGSNITVELHRKVFFTFRYSLFTSCKASLSLI